MDGVNKVCFGERLELVAWILKGSVLHVDIEGGLVHVASQLKTKCAVLFGPTPIQYFGYENNINITRGNCQNCYGMYLDINACARDMKEPECMYKILPEDVMDEIAEYMEFQSGSEKCR